MATTDKKLLLVDGMPMVYRAFFVFLTNPRLTSSGYNTSASLGYMNSLLQILEAEKPTHVAVVFDGRTKTRRHQAFPDYKAQREKTPEELVSSLQDVRDLTEALNIPILVEEGVEADDVIGTLARRAESEGFTTLMVSPDKDLGQLVTPAVRLYRPARKAADPPRIYGPQEVIQEWGVAKVAQVVDVIGLAGDAVDNIPGVPGVGAKTAQKLLGDYGSVENLIDHVDELKGKLQERIRDHAEQALLSKQLAVIDVDVPLAVEIESLQRQPLNRDALIGLFDKLEFAFLKKRLFGEGDQPELTAADDQAEPGPVAELKTLADIDHDYQVAATHEERQQLMQQLAKQKLFCFDLETTNLDPKIAEIIGVAFCWQPHHGWYVPIPQDTQVVKQVLAELAPLLGDSGITKLGHNLKYDMTVLRWHGVKVRGEILDTMVAHALVEPEARHNIDQLAQNYLGYKTIALSSLIGERGSEHTSLRDVELARAAEYAAEDADVTFQVYRVLATELERLDYLVVCNEIELPLVSVLVDMEYAGVAVDIEALQDYGLELAKEIASLEHEIYQQAGKEINLNSPKQLGEVLFDELKVSDNPKKTKTGQYRTDEQTLSRLVDRHPLVQMIQDYRVVQKLKSTYVDTLPQAVFPRTGRIHTTFNQLVATTGRMNSEGPNLQNIPIRTDRGREIRRAFVPRGPEFEILSADYSQIELRIVASISEEPAMIQDFRGEVDIHAATAAKVFGVPVELVSAEMRRKAKMVNFGIIYGISAFGLSQRLDIPRTEAAEIIDRYFQHYPGIRNYVDSTIDFAREHGYVRTLKGRRRYLRDINSRNHTARQAAERVAINAPIQGTAADMIKIAMLDIDREIRDRKLQTILTLQVHDELVFDLHSDEYDVLAPLVMKHMKEALPLQVPIVVEIGRGPDWLNAH